VSASEKPSKTFAQIVVEEDSSPIQLTPRVVIGDTVRIKISPKGYATGMNKCKTHLHGRVTLQRNDAPLSTQLLHNKLTNLWSTLNNWNITPFGRGCFEFQFNSMEDLRKVLAQGVINLKPGILRFFS